MKKGKDYIGIGVGVMLFNDKGELLLTKRGQGAKNERGCWEIPGGGVEFGETLAQAVIREAKEEIGVDIEITQQLFSIDHLIPAENQHWVATPFLATMAAGQVPKILEPHKCEAIGWYALDKLPEPLSITTMLNVRSYEEYLALQS
jgi:mutator protein MutT